MRLAATTTLSSPKRRGITLLEVLIACGLLLVGLSTMASLLPASGARLAQASVADRAGILAANALADSLNRGFLAADFFPKSSGTTSGYTLAFGAVVDQLPSFDVPTSGSNTLFKAPSAEGLRRCGSGSPRTFLLEDELRYEPPSAAATPGNAFTTDETGAPGPRRVRQGVCWGATLTPEIFPPAPGGTAVLTIAIFRRGGETVGSEEKAPMSMDVTRTSGFYEADILGSGGLLKPCSWVLAIPGTPGTAPRWFQVMASWTFGPSQATRLIFQKQQEFAAVTGSGSSGKKARIIAFDDVVRVDEHVVTLN